MIPLFHDFRDKRVVIIGGGRVARRKARTFAEEADVMVIASTFHEDFGNIDCSLRNKQVTPDNFVDDASDAFLVIPATNDTDLNAALAEIARREGCLVNRIDTVGEIILPSILKSGEITVALSTGGTSPAMSKYLRQQFAPVVERADDMVQLQRELRAELKRKVESQEKRKQLLWRVIESDEIWEHLETDYETAVRKAREIVEISR